MFLFFHFSNPLCWITDRDGIYPPLGVYVYNVLFSDAPINPWGFRGKKKHPNFVLWLRVLGFTVHLWHVAVLISSVKATNYGNKV